MLNQFFQPHIFRAFSIGSPGHDFRAVPESGCAEYWTRYVRPNYHVEAAGSQTNSLLQTDVNGIFYPLMKGVLYQNQDDAPQGASDTTTANAFYGHVLPERFYTYPIRLPNTISIPDGIFWRGDYAIEYAYDEHITNPNVVYWGVAGSGYSGSGVFTTSRAGRFGILSASATPAQQNFINGYGLFPPSNIRYVLRSDGSPYTGSAKEYALAVWSSGYPSPLQGAGWKIALLSRDLGDTTWSVTVTQCGTPTRSQIPETLFSILRMLPATHSEYGASTGSEALTSVLETASVNGTKYLVAKITPTLTNASDERALYFCSGSGTTRSADRKENHTHQHAHHTEYEYGTPACGMGFAGFNAASYSIRATASVRVQSSFLSASTSYSLDETRSGTVGFSIIRPISCGLSLGYATPYVGKIPTDATPSVFWSGMTISPSSAFGITNGLLYDWNLPVGSPPVANDDDVETEVNTPITISVLSNDTDADGDTLTITAVTTPAHGLADIAVDGKSIVYTPRMNYVGKDEFTYTVSDGVNEATATVYVSVLQI